jgi:hypothetical protein
MNETSQVGHGEIIECRLLTQELVTASRLALRKYFAIKFDVLVGLACLMVVSRLWK